MKSERHLHLHFAHMTLFPIAKADILPSNLNYGVVTCIKIIMNFKAVVSCFVNLVIKHVNRLSHELTFTISVLINVK